MTGIEIRGAETILYVNDQRLSAAFYARILGCKPTLDVPGMTEFTLQGGHKIGLMPNSGIRKLLGDLTPHPETGTGIPRCELYFLVADVEEAFDVAYMAGAKLLNPIQHRDWGHRVCYFSDTDGHIIAFAENTDGF